MTLEIPAGAQSCHTHHLCEDDIGTGEECVNETRTTGRKWDSVRGRRSGSFGKSDLLQKVCREGIGGPKESFGMVG